MLTLRLEVGAGSAFSVKVAALPSVTARPPAFVIWGQLGSRIRLSNVVVNLNRPTNAQRARAAVVSARGGVGQGRHVVDCVVVLRGRQRHRLRLIREIAAAGIEGERSRDNRHFLVVQDNVNGHRGVGCDFSLTV